MHSNQWIRWYAVYTFIHYIVLLCHREKYLFTEIKYITKVVEVNKWFLRDCELKMAKQKKNVFSSIQNVWNEVNFDRNFV